jgi:hypothetical protein
VNGRRALEPGLSKVNSTLRRFQQIDVLDDSWEALMLVGFAALLSHLSAKDQLYFSDFHSKSRATIV